MGLNHRIIMIFAISGLLAPVGVSAESLSDIYALALQNDAQFQEAQAVLKSGEEQLKSTRSALLPSIRASGGTSYTRTNRISGRDPQIETEPNCFDSVTQLPLNLPECIPNSNTKANSNSWRVELSQTIFDASAWFTWRRGKIVNQRNQTEFANQQQQLIIRVAEAYFTILRQKDNLTSIKAEEKAAKRQLEQTEQKFKVGLIAMTDVHDAQASYDAVKVRRIQAESDLLNSFTELEVITNSPHNSIAELSPDLPIRKPDGDAHEWVKKSLRDNLSLKMSQLNKDAAREALKANKAAHYPTLNATASYSDSDTGTNRSPQLTESRSYGLSLTVPIYNGGRIIADRRRAHHDLSQAMAQETLQHRQTIQQARQFYRNVATEVQRIAARQQAIKSAESALEATQVGYEVGTREIVDVLNAQQNLFSAKRDYANSRYDYVMHTLRLKQIAGSLSPEDIYALNKWLIQKPVMVSDHGSL